jgi:hypothetical protein
VVTVPDRESGPGPGSAVRFGLAVVLIVAVGVAMRSLPLFQSPLPFNPDGVLAAGWARSARRAGALPLDSLAVDDLSFTAFLAVLSEMTGVRPQFVAQPTIAVIGTLPALLAVAIGRRLAVAWGLTGSTARNAGLLAGLLLAVEGLYLHRSMPVEDQTLGLFLVPLGVIAVYRGHRRRTGAWYVAGAVLLTSIPPLHNLDTVIAATALVVLAVAARAGSPSSVRPLATIAIGFAVLAAGYNLVTAALTPAGIVQSARLLDFPGLFLAWVVLSGLTVAWAGRRNRRTGRWVVATVLGSWFALLLANAFRSVFPGTPATSRLLTYGLLPLVVPVALGTWVVPAWSDPDTEGPVFWALFGGVVATIGFSLTAALTPEYVTTIYRTQTFLHLPVLVSAGVGTASLVRWVHVRVQADPVDSGGPSSRPAVSQPSGDDRRIPDRPTVARFVGAAVVVLVIASVLASVPIAIGGLDVLPYKGVTTPAELSAAGFAATHANGSWAGDDHVIRIAPYHESHADPAAGTRQPVYRWLHDGGAPPRCPTVSQRSWTTTGAQFYPAPPARLGAARYERALRTRHLVYVATGRDPIVVTIAKHTGPASGCTA